MPQVGRLSRGGTQVCLPHGTGDLPELAVEPASPALQGSFVTTGPPGKPQLRTLRWG